MLPISSVYKDKIGSGQDRQQRHHFWQKCLALSAKELVEKLAAAGVVGTFPVVLGAWRIRPTPSAAHPGEMIQIAAQMRGLVAIEPVDGRKGFGPRYPRAWGGYHEATSEHDKIIASGFRTNGPWPHFKTDGTSCNCIGEQPFPGSRGLKIGNPGGLCRIQVAGAFGGSSGSSVPALELNRPISARSQGVASLRASATILVSRLESRSRQLREAPFGNARRNISSTC